MEENITPKPKPGRKLGKPMTIHDAILEEFDLPAEESVVEEPAVEEEIVVEEEVVVPEPAKPSSKVPPTQFAVVTAGATDPVHLSKCVRNDLQRKSLTVHHLQRRLAEWGYGDAYADRDGYYGDKTSKSVALFQADHKLPGEGVMNAETLKAIFEGDTNVKVIIDA